MTPHDWWILASIVTWAVVGIAAWTDNCRSRLSFGEYMLCAVIGVPMAVLCLAIVLPLTLIERARRNKS